MNLMGDLRTRCILACSGRVQKLYKRWIYNMDGNKRRVPKCLPKNEKVIMAAFKHFYMI